MIFGYDAPELVHEVVTPEDFGRALDSIQNHDLESKKSFQRHLERLDAAGLVRPLATVSREYVDFKTAELMQRYPNMREVLTHVKNELMLADALGEGASFGPITIVGPPGCGKTEVAREIAKMLDVPMRVTNMEANQSGAVLSGSEKFWSNTQPGAIFELLCESPVANPLLLLDEVEKGIFEPGRPHSGAAGLYGLLDRESSKSFRDLSIGLAMDVSKISIIMTANDLGPLRDHAPALLTRMTIFEVPGLTEDQAKRVFQNIFGDLVTDFRKKGLHISSDLPPLLVHEAAKILSPREMHTCCRSLIAGAVAAGRSMVSMSDFRMNPRSQETDEKEQGAEKKIDVPPGKKRFH